MVFLKIWLADNIKIGLLKRIYINVYSTAYESGKSVLPDVVQADD